MIERTMTEAEVVALCNRVRKAAYCEVGNMLADFNDMRGAGLVLALIEHEYPEEAKAA